MLVELAVWYSELELTNANRMCCFRGLRQSWIWGGPGFWQGRLLAAIAILFGFINHVEPRFLARPSLELQTLQFHWHLVLRGCQARRGPHGLCRVDDFAYLTTPARHPYAAEPIHVLFRATPKCNLTLCSFYRDFPEFHLWSPSNSPLGSHPKLLTILWGTRNIEQNQILLSVCPLVGQGFSYISVNFADRQPAGPALPLACAR